MNLAAPRRETPARSAVLWDPDGRSNGCKLGQTPCCRYINALLAPGLRAITVGGDCPKV